MSEREGESRDRLEHYMRLLQVAEQQVALASRGELHAVEQLAQRWEELAREMPSTPPAAAGPLLERASVLSQRLRAELEQARQSLLGELAGTAHAWQATQTYALAPQRTRRVDHCV